MDVSPFDTLAAARSLEAAGLPRAQAEAVTETVRKATKEQTANLVTKADLYRALLIQGAAIIAAIGTLAGLSELF